MSRCSRDWGGMTTSTGMSKSGKVTGTTPAPNELKKVLQREQDAMPRLDDIDLDAVEDRIPPPDRVQVLLEKLVSRRAEFAGNVDARLDGLRAEPNLYRLAETGDLGIDEGLSTPIQELRAQKAKLAATIDRIVAPSTPLTTWTERRSKPSLWPS